MGTIRIGCGSAYADDVLDPAIALADSGRVDYMAFDSLAERTMALAQVRKRADPATGHDTRLAKLVPAMTGFIGRGGTVIGNFGAANPAAAAAQWGAILHDKGLSDVPLGVITGDDVTELMRSEDFELAEIGSSTAELGARLVSANAYIGAEPILTCLQQGARVIMGGRLADPSLFVAPICHEMGWSLTDWDKVGLATLVGHLLECGSHGIGGNFEDPPYRLVKDPHNLAAPFAEISSDGAEHEPSMVITKLEGTGGAVDTRTMRTQLYYEIHDPAHYLTPDVTADFTGVSITEIGPDRCEVARATGSQRPDTLKVLVGVDFGWKALGEAYYGGPGCVERAARAEEILRLWLQPWLDQIDEFRIDLEGVNALFGDQIRSGYPSEVRLRLALRCRSRAVADAAVYQVERLWFGPSGGGGITTSIVPALAVTPAFVPRDLVPLQTEIVTTS